MRQKIKRTVLGICLAACLLSLTACSKAGSGAEEIRADISQQLETLPGSFLELYVTLPEEQYEDFQYQMGSEDAYVAVAEGLDAWIGVKDDLGELKSIGEIADVEAIDGGYSATVKAEFEKRNMEFSVTTDSKVSKITSVSFVPEYTMGENMKDAFLNMVIGMGTVFAVLIFISLLISCFKFINQFETKMKNKGKAAAEKAPEAFVPRPEPVFVPEEDLTDDLELVAVITAAIAASEGTSPSGLVVRSIKRAPASKWKRV